MTLSSKALAVYNHVNRKADRFFETGWRRAFGWLGFIVGYVSYVHAPLHGLADQINYDAVNLFLTFVSGLFVTRTAEKIARDRAPNPPNMPGGGLVSNAAIA